MRELTGRRVMITGAAAGIGRSMAERFADEGAELVLTDIAAKPLAATADDLRRRGAVVASYVLDVTDPDAVIDVRDAVAADVGPIDVLVNNAGVVFGGPFLDVPLQQHRRTYDVNLLGAVSVVHAFLPGLIERPEAHLVTIASASGLLGLPYGATYASSKWGVLGFSESVRLELDKLGHRHVHVTTVCPSYVGTGLFDGARPPLLTPMLTPDALADQVVRAVQRDRSMLMTPWLVKLVPLLKGVLPGFAVDLLSDVLGATTSMAQWRGHAAPREEPVTEPVDLPRTRSARPRRAAGSR